jgi:hypothetical protein
MIQHHISGCFCIGYSKQAGLYILMDLLTFYTVHPAHALCKWSVINISKICEWYASSSIFVPVLDRWDHKHHFSCLSLWFFHCTRCIFRVRYPSLFAQEQTWKCRIWPLYCGMFFWFCLSEVLSIWFSALNNWVRFAISMPAVEGSPNS